MISDKTVKIYNTSRLNYFSFDGKINDIKQIKNDYPIISILEGKFIDFQNNYIITGEFKDDFENCEIYNSNSKCYIERITERDEFQIIQKELVFEGYINNFELSGTLKLRESNIKYIGTLHKQKMNII